MATNFGKYDHGLCLDRSVALTLEGLIRPHPWWPHSMVVRSGCIYPSVVESFAWFLYISSPWSIVIVCHAIATDGGVGGVLDHGLCLAWIHVSVSVLLELVVWKPLCLDPSDGVFGRFDLAALGGCHTLNVCYVMLCYTATFCWHKCCSTLRSVFSPGQSGATDSCCQGCACRVWLEACISWDCVS